MRMRWKIGEMPYRTIERRDWCRWNKRAGYTLEREIMSTATVTAKDGPVRNLRVVPAPADAQANISTSLSAQPWLLKTMVAQPFAVKCLLAFPTIDAMVDFGASDNPAELDLNGVFEGTGTDEELALLGLYPSGAVRGISGGIRGKTLTLEDPLCLLDPGSEIDGLPDMGLECSVIIAAFAIPADDSKPV